MKEPDIASGRVEDLLAAIAKPKVEHAAQGQTAANFDMSVPDEMQGQQRREPMLGQPQYIRPDEGLRPTLAPDSGFPPQALAGDGTELAPEITPTVAPDSREP